MRVSVYVGTNRILWAERGTAALLQALKVMQLHLSSLFANVHEACVSIASTLPLKFEPGGYCSPRSQGRLIEALICT
jgi:hypothetical protein